MSHDPLVKFWHKADTDELHHKVFEHVRAVKQEQSDIDEQAVLFARLYSNREEPGLHTGARGQWRDGWSGVTENVIRSVIDTAGSLIGKSRPRIRVLTEGGDWSIQTLAKQLDKYLWGQFQALDIHDKMSDIFIDACVWGTGALKLGTRNGEVFAERVLAHKELVVDETEVPTGGKPRQMHQVRLVSRDILKALYPDKENEIEDATEAAIDRFDYREVDPDMVSVVESWYLSPGPGKKGRHSISVDTGVLFDEDWEHDFFPFVIYRWSNPRTGWYGQGLAEQLLGYQIRLNELNDFIQKCQDQIAVPKVAVDLGSKLQKVQLNNDIGIVIPYVGKPPTFFTPQALNAEMYRERDRLRTSAFEDAGISRMAAQATRPEGISAGVALRELSDNQSQRFSIQQQRFEGAHVGVGRMILEMAKKLHQKDGKAPSIWMSERFVEQIDWPEVDFDKNKYVLEVQPASILSQTPAGRVQQVVELAQYGVKWSDAELRRLLQLPDLEQDDKRATAALEHTEWVIDQLSQGIYRPPESFEDLQLSLERVTAAYLDAVRTGAPDDILETFRQRLDMTAKEMEKAAQAQQPAPQPGMGAPMPGGQQLPAGALQNTGLPGLMG